MRMVGLIACGALLVCAFLTGRYVEHSDILVAGMLVSAGLFYIGMYAALLYAKVCDVYKQNEERRANKKLYIYRKGGETTNG